MRPENAFSPDAGSGVGLTFNVSLAPYYGALCPTVTPNPASVKAGESFRWANAATLAGDAGAAPAITVLTGSTPLETVAPGGVGGWLSYPTPNTYSYTIATTPQSSIACSGIGGTVLFTLFVTAN